MGQKWLHGCSFNMNHKQFKAATFKYNSHKLLIKLAGQAQTQT